MPIKTLGQYQEEKLKKEFGSWLLWIQLAREKQGKENDMEKNCKGCEDWKPYDYSYGGHEIGKCILLGDGLGAMATRDNMSCPRWKERELPDKIANWEPEWMSFETTPVGGSIKVLAVVSGGAMTMACYNYDKHCWVNWNCELQPINVVRWSYLP
jgi:hypothetical protein